MTRLKNSFFLLVASCALAISFFPWPLHFLSCGALVPLFLLIETKNNKKVFWTGFFFGFCFSIFLLFWLIFLQVPLTIKAWLIFGFFLLSTFIGFYFATFTLLTSWLGLTWAPLVLITLEYIRSIGEIGFPWGVLGYSIVPYTPIIQIAAVFGIWGISFWIVLVNLALHRLIKVWSISKLRLPVLLYLIGLILVPLLYGILRIEKNQPGAIRVAIIQPNIDPNLKSTREMKQKMFDILRDDAKSIKELNVDMIILPETALPVNIEREPIYYNQVKSISDSTHCAILTGSLLYERSEKSFEVYNGAVFFKPDSGIVEKYRKIHLVPFSEKIPYSRFIPFLRKLDFGGGDFTHGKEYVIFKLKGEKFATLICFESIFGDLTRKFILKGADILVNITNDGWFGDTPGPYQHADMAIIRAVENRVPLVRCANTGISMIVDQYGRIIKKTPIFEKALITGDIPNGSRDSFYTRFGDFLPLISLLTTVVLIILRAFGILDKS